MSRYTYPPWAPPLTPVISIKYSPLTRTQHDNLSISKPARQQFALQNATVVAQTRQLAGCMNAVLDLVREFDLETLVAVQDFLDEHAIEILLIADVSHSLIKNNPMPKDKDGSPFGLTFVDICDARRVVECPVIFSCRSRAQAMKELLTYHSSETENRTALPLCGIPTLRNANAEDAGKTTKHALVEVTAPDLFRINGSFTKSTILPEKRLAHHEAALASAKNPYETKVISTCPDGSLIWANLINGNPISPFGTMAGVNDEGNKCISLVSLADKEEWTGFDEQLYSLSAI